MAVTVESMRTPVEGYIIQFWGLPEYTNWVDESMSWKETCMIGDWTFLWERHFRGPDARRLLSDISATSFEQFDIGQAKHIIHCNSAGKIINEGIVSRFGEDHFVTFGQGSYYADYKLRKGNYNATSEEDDWFNLQLQGPNSLFLLEKLSGESLRDIRFMHFRTIKIKGRDVIALRQGMTGEIGYELQAPTAYREEILDTIMEAGQEFGIRRIGGRVVMINHLEACYPTVGKDYICAYFDEENAEFREELRSKLPPLFTWHNKIAGSYESDNVTDWYRSPVEMGWTKVVKFDHDFIGRKALEEEVANPRRTMVTLVWNSEDVIDVYASLFRKDTPYRYMELPIEPKWYMWADKVMKDGKLVGVTTSRGYSYYFREMISLCAIDVAFSKPDTEVNVIWGNPGERQKSVRAKVAPAPYKKDVRRLDVSQLPSYVK